MLSVRITQADLLEGEQEADREEEEEENKSTNRQRIWVCICNLIVDLESNTNSDCLHHFVYLKSIVRLFSNLEYS